MVNWSALCGTGPTTDFVVAFGCGGNVGKHLAPLLAGIEGIKLRFVVHNTKPDIGTEKPMAASIEYVEGDLKSKEKTETALAGKPDRVVLVTPTSPEIHILMDVFIEVAKSALSDVKQIIWIMECDPPPFLAERTVFYAPVPATVAAVKASGLPVTRIEPGPFMQNFLSFYGLLPVLRSGASVFEGPFEHDPIRFVDTRDIAKAAAVITVKPPEDYVGKHIRLIGDIRPMTECIIACGAIVGRSIRYEKISEEKYAEQLRAAGEPEWSVKDMPALCRWESSYVYCFDQSELKDLLAVCGDTPTTIEKFFKDHADVLCATPDSS